MKRVNIYLSDKQYHNLQLVAKITDVKVAEHVRRAIDNYLTTLKRRLKNANDLPIQNLSNDETKTDV